MATPEIPVDEPWLAAYVDPGDDDLEPARRRHRDVQRKVRRALTRSHVELFPRITTDRGELTTSVDDKRTLS
jgi:hypothetical protein